MRHERGIEALDLHPIIKCLVETRLAWQLSVSDIAARMGSSYFTLKRYERGAEFPSGKMLLKWVDVLGFELVLRHKKSAAPARLADLLRPSGVTDARMVPLAGIEPALLAELDFESSASTSSATGAFGRPPGRRSREAGGI
jgi:transcriptional regulator with XRE-family HTH domain